MSVIRMPSPSRRSRSANLQFRQRIPNDVLKLAAGHTVQIELDEGVIVPVVIGRESVQFSLRTADKSVAKARHGRALAFLETYYESVRKGPQPLTRKQTVALAGELYKIFSYSLEDNPGDPEIWEKVRAINNQVISGKDNLTTLGIFSDKKTAHKASMEKRFGPLVDLLLARENVLTTSDSRDALIVEAGKALTEAAEKLKRNAEGDYRPDTNVERFPQWEKPEGKTKKASSKGKITFQDIFDRWKNEAQPAASTVTTWRSYWRQLKEFVKHDDPTRVTKADMVAFKDSLLAAGRTAKAIRDGQLAACRTLFNYALANDLVEINPVNGVVIKQKAKAGQKMLPYGDDEVARLLALADSSPHNLVRFWLPWLTALTGARIAETAQLWGQRVVRIEGIWSIKIAPAEDGGSLKNAGSERDVPLHPALIERGFLEFVRSKGDGPLFYGAAKGGKRGRRGRNENDLDGRRHASKGPTNRLAEWIRENGFTDPRKAPNHSLRHWFKTALQKAGVLDSVADAIQGHAGSRGESDGYRHAGIQVKYEAICKVAVPGVNTKKR